ncbi:MAG TPA: hypothetical protein VIG72_10545 [Pontibacter sp.]
MKRLKTLILTCFLTAASISTFAQPTVRTKFKLDESLAYFNKKTGERMSYDDFIAIIRKNPRVSYQASIMKEEK